MYVSSREEHCQGKKYAISIYKKIAQDKPELKQIGNMKKSIKCNTLNIVVSGKFELAATLFTVNYVSHHNVPQ